MRRLPFKLRSGTDETDTIFFSPQIDGIPSGRTAADPSAVVGTEPYGPLGPPRRAARSRHLALWRRELVRERERRRGRWWSERVVEVSSSSWKEDLRGSCKPRLKDVERDTTFFLIGSQKLIFHFLIYRGHYMKCNLLTQAYVAFPFLPIFSLISRSSIVPSLSLLICCLRFRFGFIYFSFWSRQGQ